MESAGVEDVGIHCFLSQRLPVIGKLLGQRQVQTTAYYTRLAADPVKAATEQVSAKLAVRLDSSAN